jgi:hypothetical protein
MKKTSDKKIDIDKNELAHLIDAIKMYYRDHSSSVDKEMKKSIESLPSKYIIDNEMSVSEFEMYYKIVRDLWKKLVNQDLNNVDVDESVTLEDRNLEKELLDGNYWMLPGSIIFGGFNHFSIAKKHKGVFCSVLGLDGWMYEKLIVSDPNKLIFYILSNGGVRINVDKENSTVVCQTNEDSFSWVRNKLLKMYHKIKVAKVIDLKVPYRGWKSGINLVIKKPIVV